MKNDRKKQYLVLGLGRFGTSVAESLCSLGHEVLAVDADEARVEEVAPRVTQALAADATSEEVLSSLEPAAFDGAIVAMGGNVRDSILISVLLREKGAKTVIAKAADALHAKVLRKVGVDRVVFPERDMGQRLARSLATQNFLDMMEVSEDYQMAEVRAPRSWLGRTLMEVNVRRQYGVSIIAISRAGRLIPSPGAEERFQAEDVLLLLGTREQIDALDA